MTDDLPNVAPLDPRTRVSLEDLCSVLRGLEPGLYTSRDLHPRYAVWAGREGKPVATTKALGEALRRLVGPGSTGQAHGNVGVYRLTAEMVGAQSRPD